MMRRPPTEEQQMMATVVALGKNNTVDKVRRKHKRNEVHISLSLTFN